MKKRPVAIFDLDGTLYFWPDSRDFATALLFKELLALRLIPNSDTAAHWQKIRMQHTSQRAPGYLYDMEVVDLMLKSIVGLKQAVVQEVANKVAARQYQYFVPQIMQLLQFAQEKKYHVMLVSNSIDEIVGAFARKLGIEWWWGNTFLVDSDGNYTGTALDRPKKHELIEQHMHEHGLSWRNSIGAGDGNIDRKYLAKVETAICVNPHQLLYEQAIRNSYIILRYSPYYRYFTKGEEQFHDIFL